MTEEEIAVRVCEELTRIVMPALAQLEDRINGIGQMIGAMLVRPSDVPAILAEHLPETQALKPLIVRSFAEYQAERLAESGYVLVAVAGSALETATSVALYRKAD